MLKIFRRIRQNLLSENKFSKYVLYAIGEIILVVIGILIALQINNWNESRKSAIQEKNYYTNIKRQLNEDNYAIKSSLIYNANYLNQFKNAIEIIEEGDRTMADSLANISINLLDFSDFHRQSNIYETMVNSGEIKLLKNQQIIERLQRLEEKYILINKLENTHSEAVLDYVVPSLVTSIKINKMQVEDIEKLYAFEFQNLFTLLTDLMQEKNDIYLLTSTKIEELIELIDKEVSVND